MSNGDKAVELLPYRNSKGLWVFVSIVVVVLCMLRRGLLSGSIVSELPPLAFSHASIVHHFAHIWVRLEVVSVVSLV